MLYCEPSLASMAMTSVLGATPAGHIRCHPHSASTTRRSVSSLRKGQTANSSLEVARGCQEGAHAVPAASAGHRRCRHGRCARQHPLVCAASAGGSDTELGSVWSSATASTASQELASRLSAPSAVQHSTDARPASAATQSATTAPVADIAAPGINGAGNGEAAAGRSPIGRTHGQDESRRRPADQHEQPPESGVLAHAQFGDVLSNAQSHRSPRGIPTDAALTSKRSGRAKAKALFLPDEKSQIRDSWRKIMRWSKVRAVAAELQGGLVQTSKRSTSENIHAISNVPQRTCCCPCARCSTGTTGRSWRRLKRSSYLAAAALAQRWALRWRGRKRILM